MSVSERVFTTMDGVAAAQYRWGLWHEGELLMEIVGSEAFKERHAGLWESQAVESGYRPDRLYWTCEGARVDQRVEWRYE